MSAPAAVRARGRLADRDFPTPGTKPRARGYLQALAYECVCVCARARARACAREGPVNKEFLMLGTDLKHGEIRFLDLNTQLQVPMARVLASLVLTA